MHAIYFPISPPSPRFSLRSQTKDRRWAETVLAFPQYFSLRGCNGLEVSEWASVSVTITPVSSCWNEGERGSIPFSGLVRALWAVSRVPRDLIDSFVSLSLLRCDC